MSNQQNKQQQQQQEEEEFAFIQSILDIVAKDELEYRKKHEQGITWPQLIGGGFTLTIGGLLAWRGFHWGVQRALADAAEEVKLDVKTAERARTLAWKAFARGSVFATVGASCIGIGIALLIPKLPKSSSHGPSSSSD